MTANYLTDQKYWQTQISGFKPHHVAGHDFEPVLLRYLPVDSKLTCVEIGAYPGVSLCYLAKKFGYRPTAIEYRDDADDIRRLFEFNGIPNFDIVNDDFLHLKGLQFDVVTSFGFVEHFADYQEVIRLHVEMMKPGGYLVLTVPHFWGVQGIMRRAVLTEPALTELLETHNQQIMNLTELKKTVTNMGLSVLFGKYVMGGSFWLRPDSPKIKPSRKWLTEIISQLDRVILGKIPSCFLYSPMILCIARKGN